MAPVVQAGCVTRPEIWLCRHGETEWSRDGRHTSRTDLPLTPAGMAEARRLATRVSGVKFDLVLTSPKRRAADTAAIAGFPDAVREPAAQEWDYGEGEGRTTAAIREEVPGWTVWTHMLPGSETADQVGARADRLIGLVQHEAPTRALLFSHAHFLRVLAARWIGLPATAGVRLLLDTGSVSVLGWERDVRAIKHWNTE
jgi:probable phosphoglycerate mutase